MAMDLRDFELIAESLKALRHRIDSDALETVAYGLASTFHLTYLVFEKDKFLRDCGVEPFGPKPPLTK
jgi:hypothetical protein